MARRAQETTGYVLLGVFGLLLLWLLTKGKSLLHESVSAGIVTPLGTVVPDQYGIPQFDTTIPATVPRGQGSAVPPINMDTGAPDWNPSNPARASCPSGSQLWHNVSDGTYQCILGGYN